jgi:hypothetical protein
MYYELMKMRHGQPNDMETTSGYPFEMVKDDVKQWVDDGIYDRIEVRDSQGQLVFHYPRVTRPLNNPS